MVKFEVIIKHDQDGNLIVATKMLEADEPKDDVQSHNENATFHLITDSISFVTDMIAEDAGATKFRGEQLN